MSLPVAVLAGGLATRLYPLTLKTPKSLIKVNGRPFIELQLNLLKNSGIESVVLCLGNMAQDIIDYLGNGSRFGLDLQFSVEERPLGTGGALKKAESLLGETFGVLYGDAYLPIDYQKVFMAFENSQRLAVMTICRNESSFYASNVEIGKNGDLVYSKKSPRPQMTHIDYGFSVLQKQALFRNESGLKFDLSDLFEELSLVNQIEAYKINQRFYEVGSLKGIIDLETYLKSGGI